MVRYNTIKLQSSHSYIVMGPLSLLLMLLCMMGACTGLRCAKENMRPRIAVGFYGISRSLQYVMPTLKRHVFDVLDRASITYDVLWSTNTATETVNTRKQYPGVTGGIDQLEARFLEPCLVNLNDQEVVRMHEWRLFARARGIKQNEDLSFNLTDYSSLDEFHDNMESVKNLLCAYHSMNTLLRMVQSHQFADNFTYDAILVLRPDTAVMRDIDLPQYINKIKQEPNSIWIPNYEHFLGYNDRAAFGSVTAMSVYLKRGKSFRDASGPFAAAERLVKYELEKHSIVVHPSTIRVARIRQGGEFAEFRTGMEVSDEEWNRCVVLNGTQKYLNPAC